jgi:hypothetical protein
VLTALLDARRTVRYLEGALSVKRGALAELESKLPLGEKPAN